MKQLPAVCFLSTIAFAASANLPFYEPFTDQTVVGGSNYVVGSVLAGQVNSYNPNGTTNIWNLIGSNFAGPNGSQPTNLAGNLSSPNLPPSIGNSVGVVPATNMSCRLNLNAQVANGRAYYSCIVKFTDISTLPSTAADNYFTCFSDGVVAQPQRLARGGAKILTKKSGAGYVFGIGKTTTTTDFAYETTNHNANDIIFLVAAYERTNSVNTAYLWVNPPTDSFGSNQPPPFTVSTSSGSANELNTSGVQGFVIACQSANAPTAIMDELRIGTNWIQVTGGDPAIVTAPANQIVPPGGTATFSAAARGTAALSYQWYKDGVALTDGGHFGGSATTNLTVSSVSVGEVGTYVMYVTNGTGNFANSLGATLSLSDPAITGQPQSRTNNFGTTATFQVTALGTAPFTYQWHKAGFGDLADGGNISGSKTNLLSLTGVSAADAGTYSVTVSNALGVPVDSSNAVLTVLDPAISSQPVSITNVAGANVSFHVVAAGTGGFTYQWYKNGAPLSNTGNISGSDTDTLGVSGISLADDADYNVVVTGLSSTASQQAHLTVETPVTITVQPTSRTVPAGTSTVLAVGATGYAPLAYQWQLEGTNVPGANSSAYPISNVQPAIAGNYRVIVSNVLNAATSSVATLAIANSLHFYSSNLAVIRIGNGAQSLTPNGNSMFMDQFTINGSYVCTLAIPDTGTNATIAIGPTIVNLSQTSTSVSGTALSRSLDGQQLVVAAYNTAIGFNSSLNTVASTSVPRAIGWINSLGQYKLALSSTDSTFSATFFRAAVSDGTNNFWGAARTPSTYYFGFDAPATPIQSIFPNMRSMAQFNGDIYCASAVGGNNGILKLTGLATTAGAANPTVLFPGSTSTSDMDVSPDGNVIYVADSRNGPSGGIQRWQFDTNSQIWSLAYTLSDSLPSGAYYVTADWSGANPVVYAITSDDSNNRLVQIVDSGAGSTGTTLAYAGVNQNFRGIRLGPVETPINARPALLIAPDGNNVVVQWAGAFVLQSATNVSGPYTDIVPTATSPYTNSTSGSRQLFFRLRN